MAAIGWRMGKGRIDYLCAGSVISEFWIVTTAHCTHGQIGGPSLVKLGNNNLYSSNEGIYEIETIIRHPRYKPPSMYADIALIKVSKEIIFTDNIRPACLHTKFSDLPEYAWAAGWGAKEYNGEPSSFLQKSVLTLVDNIRCTKMYNESYMAPFGITPGMICAGDPDDDWRKDTCNGDSGAPLQVIYSGNCLYTIIGITSFGQACATPNLPGVYIRAAYYSDWIESIVWPN
ncbi:serine protease snake-like [Prorops nasuta]|uniref:serine protease snake-like n=1 Tax=Prorops nasuta TaxID=863751 RepID=UPI0034CDE023